MSRTTGLKVKISKWSKKHKKELIVLCGIAFLILCIINTILKNKAPKIDPPSTTYTPHQSVYQEDVSVPKNYQQPIEDLVEKYFNYCNNGEYENAYNLITEDCRNKVYPTLTQFKGYVDHVFQGKKKIYNIQNYSVVDNKYIYNVRILDDILATGTTDGYSYYEEKLILIEDNGQFKLSIGEYIGEEKLNIVAENDSMKVEIINKTVEYETETYTVKVTNKTNQYLVLLDNTQKDEILLNLGEQTRKPINTANSIVYLEPNSNKVETFVFNKFYDNGLKSQKLVFNSVRVLNEYDAKQGTTQANIDSAVRIYGYEINLNK